MWAPIAVVLLGCAVGTRRCSPDDVRDAFERGSWASAHCGAEALRDPDVQAAVAGIVEAQWASVAAQLDGARSWPLVGHGLFSALLAQDGFAARFAAGAPPLSELGADALSAVGAAAGLLLKDTVGCGDASKLGRAAFARYAHGDFFPRLALRCLSGEQASRLGSDSPGSGPGLNALFLAIAVSEVWADDVPDDVTGALTAVQLASLPAAVFGAVPAGRVPALRDESLSLLRSEHVSALSGPAAAALSAEQAVRVGAAGGADVRPLLRAPLSGLARHAIEARLGLVSAPVWLLSWRGMLVSLSISVGCLVLGAIFCFSAPAGAVKKGQRKAKT